MDTNELKPENKKIKKPNTEQIKKEDYLKNLIKSINEMTK